MRSGSKRRSRAIGETAGQNVKANLREGESESPLMIKTSSILMIRATFVLSTPDAHEEERWERHAKFWIG
jgi:hypothetical protein